MRIGLVCPYSFQTHGGVQNHIRGLAAHLRDQGHYAHILAPGEPPERQAGVGFTSAGGAVPVPYNGSVARVNFGPLSAARVNRWLRDHSFDLLHIHEPITPSIALLALWAADVPVVATFHTATPKSRSMQLAGGALRASIEKIDAGIAVSASARQVVVQYLRRDPVIVPNGFFWRDFAEPTSLGRYRPVAAPRRLLFVGRLDEPRKGLSVLLEALPTVRAQLPDVELVVAGQGSAVLPAGCRNLGAVDDRTKVALLAEADVFVAPHRERESFGIVLLEAMAAGAPIVASALPPFNDLLLAPAPGGIGRGGRTVPPGDPAALADAVIQTLRHPDPIRVREARERARRYDWSVVGPAVVRVYRDVLADSGGTRRLAQ
jgi:phosphatidylinositol alpha-mannosyltransferase